MFDWIPVYATDIPIVDEQHQKLFQMISQLAAKMESGDMSTNSLEQSMDDLLEYAYQHFVDEERYMARLEVDDRHQKLQRMQHHAFIYDVKKMRSSWDDTTPIQNFDNLLRFVTSWLVYHTLRTDIHLGLQVEAIKEGKSPEKAYLHALSQPLDYRIYEKVIEALVHLWTDALEQVKGYEEQIELERNAA